MVWFEKTIQEILGALRKVRNEFQPDLNFNKKRIIH